MPSGAKGLRGCIGPNQVAGADIASTDASAAAGVGVQADPGSMGDGTTMLPGPYTVPPESMGLMNGATAGTLTTPAEAKQFVDATKVDVLAPAVGNMHGMLESMVHGNVQKRLNIERIAEIKAAVKKA